jgi:hypothetical protein
VTEKPLFIVVAMRYFKQFQDGTKPGMEEFRPYGARWNEQTCRVGRECIISAGYGKKHRLHGQVAGFRVDQHTICWTPAWEDCYGPGLAKVACIQFKENPHA